MKRRLLFAAAAAVLAGQAVAQSYPTRPVRMIVPFPAGGGSDSAARAMSPRLAERLKQQIVIDNRPGAAGSIGTELAAKAPADGYTLLLGSVSEIALYPVVTAKVPYDPVRDLTPIALTAEIPFLLVVHPSLPVKSVKDLIALAKARPGEIHYGSAGTGATSHLTMAMLASLSGAKMTHVPYKGSVPAATDLTGGHLQAMMPPMPSVMPLIKGNRLRGLAVSSAKRWPTSPEFPTVAEAGVPGYEVILWTGVLGPRGLAPEIVALLHREIAQVLTMPDVKAGFARQGAEINSLGPEQFGALIKADLAKWAKAVKDANVKVE